MKAILWDGHKQINGELVLEKKRIKFRLADFSDTDLGFDLAYRQIQEVSYHSLYEISLSGLNIKSKNKKSNIFIVEEPQTLKQAITARCNQQVHLQIDQNSTPTQNSQSSSEYYPSYRTG